MGGHSMKSRKIIVTFSLFANVLFANPLADVVNALSRPESLDTGITDKDCLTENDEAEMGKSISFQLYKIIQERKKKGLKKMSNNEATQLAIKLEILTPNGQENEKSPIGITPFLLELRGIENNHIQLQDIRDKIIKPKNRNRAISAVPEINRVKKENYKDTSKIGSGAAGAVDPSILQAEIQRRAATQGERAKASEERAKAYDQRARENEEKKAIVHGHINNMLDDVESYNGSPYEELTDEDIQIITEAYGLPFDNNWKREFKAVQRKRVINRSAPTSP